MTEWVMYSLLGIPLVCGVLAWMAKSSQVRNLIVVVSAIAVAACGLTLVKLSLDAPDGVWTYSVSSHYEWVGSLLEGLIILLIGFIAIRIRNLWISVFALIQLGLAIACYAVKGHEEEFITLFRIDDLSRIMLLVTSVVGSLILIFAIGYMKLHAEHAPRHAASQGQFFFVFISFLGFMSGLVISDNLAFFSLFWEATTLCSYALIGQDGGDARKYNATRALLINSFGGVLLLAGVLCLKCKVGGESFGVLLQNHSVTLVPAVLLCIAAFTKSALFPFQSWLLGAMVAPTPVSAMLHAATMVKAGVYLVMRLTPSFYDQRAMIMVAVAGSLTFVGGALLACTQSNGKKVLAYSTISNLGLVVACAGFDSPLAYAAGLAIITFHAISKGLLFLCVGRIEQVIGSRDIEDMDGLLFKMPFTTCVAWLGMISMLLPPFGMLLSKWLAIEATIRSPFLLVFMVLGSALTVFFWAKWIGRLQNIGYHESMPKEVMPAPMRFSLSLLALFVLGTGLTTMLIFDKVFSPMARHAFSGHAGINWPLFDQVSNFTIGSYIIFGAIGIGAILYYVFFWCRFKSANVRLPYLCGENVDAAMVSAGDDIKTYDFRSVGDKIEHSVISSLYFTGIVGEKPVTRCLNWAGWLIIIVLLGYTIFPAVKNCNGSDSNSADDLKNRVSETVSSITGDSK